MYYFFFGEDSYRSREALQSALQKQKGDGDIVRYDASSDTLAIESHIRGVSLFGKRECVVISHPLSGTSENWKEIEIYLEDIKKSDTPLFFWEGEILKKNKKQADVLEHSAAKTTEYSYLANSALKKHIQALAAEKKCAVSSKDIDMLAENFGGDLWAISGELEKYALTGTFEYAKAVHAEEKLYDFLDALSEKNHARAYELLEGIFKAEFEIPYVMAALAGMVRNMLKIKSIMPQSPDYRMLEIFNMHPYVLKKTISHSRRFRLEDLKRLYKKILEADIASKTSETDPVTLFTRLISEF